MILELGSWYGASTEYLAQNAPPGAKIYAVDFWDNRFIVQDQGDHYHDGGTKEGSKVMRMLDRHDLYDTFLANLWRYRDTVVPLRMSTLDGVQWLKERNIVPDVIYIDADHHYEAALQDIRHSLLAFPGALCVGDDYGNYEGVKNAVLECAREFKKTVHVDQNHCWAYMRINSDTGKRCVGSGCFMSEGYNTWSLSIDECASTCQYMGNNVFPWYTMSTQEMDITLTNSDKVVIGQLNGTQINSESLRFNKCVAFSSFTLLEKTVILGGTMQNGMYNSFSSLDDVVANIGDAASVKVQLPVLCKRWYWVASEDTLGNPSGGRCYLEQQQ